MKKILLGLVLSLLIAGNAFAANTAVLTGNRIVITGDPIADDGDFDVWAALGWTVGTDKVTIDYYCFYGSNIVIGDVAELETADGKPIGTPLRAVVAGQPLCHPSINCTVDRLYVDQLSHGSIIIFIHQVGTPR